MKSLFGFFVAPHHPDYEKDKQIKFLHITLLVTMLSGIYFALNNSGATATAFWVLAGTSVLGMYLNHVNQYYFSASLLTGMTIFALYFNFYDGISLQDPGIMALPILLIISSFLFNRKSIYPIALILILGIHTIVRFERLGIISPPTATSDDQVIIMDILLVITAILLSVIMKYWEVALEKTRSSEQRVKDSYLQTLEGWAKTLEYHDRETVGHSRRVTELSLDMARAIGIEDQEELENIRRGALLHDIGKIAIKDNLLQKEGKLSDSEREEIQKHPIWAKELLENTPFLQPALSIPYYHHENWDGNGYPFGLSGEDIPLHARLFSIVDNWDALTNDRPYREAWPVDKVKSYIQEEAGKKFDPSLVPIFLTLID